MKSQQVTANSAYQVPYLRTHESQHSMRQQQQESIPNRIFVPEDYNEGNSPDQYLKEKFFESLGLPGDLSDNAIQHFNFKQATPMGTNNFQSLQPNEEEIESHMFKSCIGGASPGTVLHTGPRGNTPGAQSQPYNHQNFLTSQNSYRTALANTGAKNQPTEYKRTTIGQNGSQINLETGFIDSQRKQSAPTPFRQQQQQFAMVSNPSSVTGGDFHPSQQQWFSGSNAPQQDNKELLTITVEIGHGQQANILIRQNDDPFLLASSFALQHNISDQLRDLLADQIRYNMEQVLLEDQFSSTMKLQNYQVEEPFQYQNDLEDLQQQHIGGEVMYERALEQEESMAKNGQSFQKNTGSEANLFPNQLFQPAGSFAYQRKGQADEKSYMNNTNQSFLTERSAGSMYVKGGKQVSGYQQLEENLQYERTNQPKINENSKRIVENRRGSSAQRGSVHSRLHQQAVSKQKAQQRNLPPTVPQDMGYGNKTTTMEYSQQSSPQRMNANMQAMGPFQMMQMLSNNQMRERASSLQHQRANQNNDLQQEDPNMTTISGSQRSSQRPPQALNYGERLYQKGLKRKEEFDRHIREAKSEQEKMNQEQFSFHPQINAMSKHAIRANNEKAEDFLLNYGKAAREKLEQKKAEILFEEQKECKFRPSITKKSEKMLSERYQGTEQRPSLNKFSNLYDDAKRRQERQEKIYSACMEAECTFYPDTNLTKAYNSKLDINPIQERTDFTKHRSGSREHSQQNILKSNISNNDLFDPETGQPYFHPKVGRAPRSQRRPTPKEGATGVMLYEKGKETKERMEQKKKAFIDEELNRAQTIHTKDNTNRIIEKVKIQTFAEIFKQLDSDGDSQISAQRIDISSLGPDLLEVLTPLFCEMEEMGQTLDEEEFIDAVGRLYDTLSLTEKNVILKQKQRQERSKSKIESQPYFKPQLNANSLRIASQKRADGDVADRLIQKQQEYYQKIYEKQQEKENLELVGCTFHPKILQSPSDSYSNNRSRVYTNKQMMLMMDGSSNGNTHFDINNLASNIASELMHQQQVQGQYNTHGGILGGNLNYMNHPQVDMRNNENIQYMPVTSQSHNSTQSINNGLRQQLMMMH